MPGSAATPSRELPRNTLCIFCRCRTDSFHSARFSWVLLYIRLHFPRKSAALEVRDDEAIGKARPVESPEESAMAAVARAHDGEIRRRRESHQIGRRNHRIVLRE